MNNMVLDSRSMRMLQMLAQGAGSKDIAKELGYQDGTMRVYLHNLYRKLGVANKTAAVIWYMQRHGHIVAEDSGAPASAPQIPSRKSDPVGDMALAEGLYATLGVMGSYIGPWSRVWEAGAKAAGEDVTADPEGQRARSRNLWNLFLRGEFSTAKAMYDADGGYGFLASPGSDGVLLASLLVAGGFSHAARQFTSKLSDRRRARPATSAREMALLEAAFEAFESRDASAGLARLQKAAEGHAPPAFRQLATAMLFHAARARRDQERARHAANALWTEAETAAQELRTAGATSVAAPKRAAAKSTSREKAAAG